ncbi:hypothetical protein PCYB_008070, partial [Plasmodium cynomolgi strain B]
DIWDLYEEFNKTIIDDTRIQTNNFCENIPKNPTDIHENQKVFCKKLIRNLVLCNDNENAKDSIDRCTYLKNWLYFENKKWQLSDTIIQNIFSGPIYLNDGNPIKPCSYISNVKPYDKDKELNDLDVFITNNEILKRIYKEKIESDDCKFKSFISKCIKKYKSEIVEFYHNGQQNNLCDQDIPSYLKLFKRNYSDLSKIRTKNGNIPEINSDNIENFFKCSSIDKEQLVSSTTNTECSTTNTTPTVIGILAGIFSLLGLAYKVGMHLI